MNERDPIEVREMLRSSGWKIVKRDIENAIKSYDELLKNIDDELPIEEIGSKHVKYKRVIDGLREAIIIAEKYYGK